MGAPYIYDISRLRVNRSSVYLIFYRNLNLDVYVRIFIVQKVGHF